MHTLQTLPKEKFAYCCYPSGKIVFSSNSFWDRLLEFYHVKIKKNWLPLNEDLFCRLLRFSNALQKRIASEKENFIRPSPDSKKEIIFRKNLHALFDLAEDLSLSLGSLHDKNLEEGLKKIYRLNVKENEKLLKHLHFLTEMFGGLQALNLASYQTIKEKSWNEQVETISKAGFYLAELTANQNHLRAWLPYIDLEGKQALFFNVSMDLLFSELKNHSENKKQEDGFKHEVDLLAIYIEGLLTPNRVSQELAYSLKNAFEEKSKSLEILDPKLSANFRRVETLKNEISEKLKIVLGNKINKEEELFEIQEKLCSPKNEEIIFKPYALEKLSNAIPKITYEPLAPYKEALNAANNSMQILTKLIGDQSEAALKEAQDKLFQIGVIRPSLEELLKPEKLLSVDALSLPFRKAVNVLDNERYALRKESEHLETIINKTEESLKIHIKALLEELEINDTPERRDHLKLLEEDLELAKNFNNTLKTIKENALLFNLQTDPLLITKEEVEKAYSEISSPLYSEGARGRLPENFSHLEEAYQTLLQSLEKKEACLLTPLMIYKQNLKVPLKEIESLHFLLNDKLKELEHIQSQELSNDSDTEALFEKEIKKLDWIEINKETEDIEKTFRTLRAISAVLTTTALLNQ